MDSRVFQSLTSQIRVICATRGQYKSLKFMMLARSFRHANSVGQAKLTGEEYKNVYSALPILIL